jgi:hypothetical protein
MGRGGNNLLYGSIKTRTINDSLFTEKLESILFSNSSSFARKLNEFTLTIPCCDVPELEQLTDKIIKKYSLEKVNKTFFQMNETEILPTTYNYINYLARYGLLDKHGQRIVKHLSDLQLNQQVSYIDSSTVYSRIGDRLQSLIDSRFMRTDYSQVKTEVIKHQWYYQKLDISQGIIDLLNEHYQGIEATNNSNGNPTSNLEYPDLPRKSVERALFEQVWPQVGDNLKQQVYQQLEVHDLFLTDNQRKQAREIADNLDDPQYPIPELEKSFRFITVDLI